MSLYLSAKQFWKFVFEHTWMLRASKRFKNNYICPYASTSHKLIRKLLFIFLTVMLLPRVPGGHKKRMTSRVPVGPGYFPPHSCVRFIVSSVMLTTMLSARIKVVEGSRPKSYSVKGIWKAYLILSLKQVYNTISWNLEFSENVKDILTGTY